MLSRLRLAYYPGYEAQRGPHHAQVGAASTGASIHTWHNKALMAQTGGAGRGAVNMPRLIIIIIISAYPLYTAKGPHPTLVPLGHNTVLSHTFKNWLVLLRS